MKFLATMTYEKEDYDAFVRMSGKLLTPGKTVLVRVGFIAIAVIAVLLSAYLFYSGGGDKNNVTIGVLLIIVAFAALFRTIFHYPYEAYQLRKNQKANMGESTYTFKADRFVLENDLGTREYTYDKLLNVAETQDHFFLMLNESSALVLPKRSFKMGTPKAFHAFLEEKTGQKIVTATL